MITQFSWKACCYRNGKRNNMKMKNLIFTILGFIFIGFGIIGIIVTAIPFLIFPTTPFILLAAGCFSIGNKKLSTWLSNNRIFGPFIENYKTKQGISLIYKTSGIIMLWLGLIISMIFTQELWMYIILSIIGLGVTIHLLLIKTKKKS